MNTGRYPLEFIMAKEGGERPKTGLEKREYSIRLRRNKMVEDQGKAQKGLSFFLLCLLSFVGLCLEVIIVFLIEPLLFGKTLFAFSDKGFIYHWLVVILLWLIVAYALIRFAKQKLNFDVFASKSRVELGRLLLCLVLFAILARISYSNWRGFKVVKEFQTHGWLKFSVQYLYYLLEAALFVLMIVFAQQAGEIWFKKSHLPWGGIFVAVTWGLGHIFVKGVSVGLYGFLSGLMYGCVYLLCKKNLFIAYPLIWLMFVM